MPCAQHFAHAQNLCAHANFAHAHAQNYKFLVSKGPGGGGQHPHAGGAATL